MKLSLKLTSLLTFLFSDKKVRPKRQRPAARYGRECIDRKLPQQDMGFTVKLFLSQRIDGSGPCRGRSFLAPPRKEPKNAA